MSSGCDLSMWSLYLECCFYFGDSFSAQPHFTRALNVVNQKLYPLLKIRTRWELLWVLCLQMGQREEKKLNLHQSADGCSAARAQTEPSYSVESHTQWRTTFPLGLLHLLHRKKWVDLISSHGLSLMQCQFGPVPERLSVWYRTEAAGWAEGRFSFGPLQGRRQTISCHTKDVTQSLFEDRIKGTKIETTDSE